VAVLRRMQARLEQVEQAEQVNAALRREMKALLDQLLDCLIGGLPLPDARVRQPVAFAAAMQEIAPRREAVPVGNRTLRLPRTLAGLMRALLAPPPRTWRTAAELAAQLGVSVPRKSDATHAVAQAVYRLRKEMERAGLDGRMIEGRRGLGWRWKTPDKV
jgi:DNA-binding response OmpR family regulator